MPVKGVGGDMSSMSFMPYEDLGTLIQDLVGGRFSENALVEATLIKTPPKIDCLRKLRKSSPRDRQVQAATMMAGFPRTPEMLCRQPMFLVKRASSFASFLTCTKISNHDEDHVEVTWLVWAGAADDQR